MSSAYLYEHLPKTYRDYRAITPIAKAGSSTCVIRGVVSHLTATDKLVVEVKDSSGSVTVIFLKYNRYHTAFLRVNKWVVLSGKVEDGKMFHPKILAPDEIGAIKAVHSGRVNKKAIMKAIDSADSDDPVPYDVIEKRKLPTLGETFRMVYFPKDTSEIERARKRLAYTELYAEMKSIKDHRCKEGVALTFNESEVDDFILSLPFDLTTGQYLAIYDILQDLKSKTPMRRLVIGDVGSGKTEVATVAIYAALKTGCRVLYLCPTEILAIQTYHRLAKAFAGFAYVALHTASEKVKQAAPDIFVGTHALLYKDWGHHNVGLVVVDEQHKFGVRQRQNLVPYPECNLLEMSATPIPRSYALTMQNLMDISVIDELPVSRNVATEVITNKQDYERVLSVVNDEIKAGNQALIVYPSVESERANMRAAVKAFEYWRSVFGDKVDLMYGQLKDKESVLRKFMNGETRVLVSTSAVEVGIDVSRLTVCVVVNAERFGLAQLHQIRGRVGRRGGKSYFFAICKNTASIDRLRHLEAIDNGFDLADIDLMIRGFGQFSGEIQTGHFFRFFKLTDFDISEAVKEDLQQIQLTS